MRPHQADRLGLRSAYRGSLKWSRTVPQMSPKWTDFSSLLPEGTNRRWRKAAQCSNEPQPSCSRGFWSPVATGDFLASAGPRVPADGLIRHRVPDLAAGSRVRRPSGSAPLEDCPGCGTYSCRGFGVRSVACRYAGYGRCAGGQRVHRSRVELGRVPAWARRRESARVPKGAFAPDRQTNREGETSSLPRAAKRASPGPPGCTPHVPQRSSRLGRS